MKVCNYESDTVYMEDILNEHKFIIPTCQRSVVWKKQRRKDFIKNIRSGEPFGVILIRRNHDKFELIDGLQRITAIRDYINNRFDYLTEDDINDELSRKIIASFLKGNGLPITEDYINQRIQPLKSVLYECIKGGLKYHKAISVLRDEFGFESDEISDLICDIYDDFDKETDISNLKVMAINYTGPSENIPNVFYNLNTGGVKLSKYETYAALWSTPLYKISDSSILEKVQNKYTQLEEDSELDVDFNEEELRENGISLFEYCYALSSIIRNKEKQYNILFGENTSSTDPIGFEVLSLVLDEKVNKAEKLYELLKNATPNFLENLKNIIESSVQYLKECLSPLLIGKNGAILCSDSTYLIYHILTSYIKENYIIDISSETITKNIDALPNADFKKYVPLHYIYDCLTEYWRANRQVSDLHRDLNNEKAKKYWFNLKWADWEFGMQSFVDAQDSISKTIPQKNKLFIDFLIKNKLALHPQYNIHFNNNDDEKSGYLDFEHITPKKRIKSHIKDLTTRKQNNYPISSIGNICYLTTKDNRAKREKTIYEFGKDRPSYTFNTDYLTFILYPDKEQLNFINCNNADFRDGYEKFIRERAENLKKEFLDTIKRLYY